MSIVDWMDSWMRHCSFYWKPDDLKDPGLTNYTGWMTQNDYYALPGLGGVRTEFLRGPKRRRVDFVLKDFYEGDIDENGVDVGNMVFGRP